MGLCMGTAHHQPCWGSELLPVSRCSRNTAAEVPLQPPTVPLGRTCGPGCHEGSVPSALAGADRRTRQGAGGGRKLLIPLYLPLALLSHLPVTLSVSPGISCSYSCASLAAGDCPPFAAPCGQALAPGFPISAALGLAACKKGRHLRCWVCRKSINYSGRQVPGMGLCGCDSLQVGVGGKDQAQLGIVH